MKKAPLFLSCLLLTGCHRGPQPIRAGVDVAVCGMIIADPHYAAEAVGSRQVRKYDSLDGMRQDRTRNARADLYVTDFDSGRLLAASRATVLESSRIHAPMGGHTIAFHSRDRGLVFVHQHHVLAYRLLPFADWYRQPTGAEK